ncbi:MAG: hypothetical protein JEY91_09790 [Spirochaetaceae bacterium]|nr:hypothetical protein [Spirochaetaceae bacterium]
MRKFALMTIIAILLFSCSKGSEEKTDLLKEYVYNSPTGNSMIISILDREFFTSEKISFQCSFAYKKDFIPEFPDWNSYEDSMDIIQIRELTVMTDTDDRIVRSFELLMDNQLPGEYLLNPLEIRFVRDGGEIDTIRSEYIPITVLSALFEGSDELIDDFETINRERNPMYLIVLILFLLATTSIIIYLVLKRKKTKPHNQTEKKESYETRINSIKKDNIKELYSELNNLIREYLDNKVFLSVQSQTTEEFVNYSKSSPVIEDWLKVQLYGFFKRCDEVTFGTHIPDETQIDGDIRFCRDFISHLDEKVTKEVPHDF